MPDHPSDKPESTSAESPGEDRDLPEWLRRRTTPEAMRDEWAKMRGEERSTRLGPRLADDLRELWTAVAFARPVYKVGAAVSVALAALLVVAPLMISSDDIRMPGRKGQEYLGAGASLPRNLRLSPSRLRVELYEDGHRLSGVLEVTNSPPGVHLFRIELLHKRSVGGEERVRGLLSLTNAPGRRGLKSVEDVSGAVLEGVLEGPNLPPTRIRMEFGTDAQ